MNKTKKKITLSEILGYKRNVKNVMLCFLKGVTVTFLPRGMMYQNTTSG